MKTTSKAWLAFVLSGWLVGGYLRAADPLRTNAGIFQTGGHGASAGAGENGRVYARSVWRWNLAGYLWHVSTGPDPFLNQPRDGWEPGSTVRSICPGDPLCLTYLVVVEEPKD